VEATGMVRPERDDELRIEAASRAAGGPWAYTGTRECPACESDAQPVHPDHTDRQICGRCGVVLPGDPVTWAIREDTGGSSLFVLRQGDQCAVGGAPQRSGDDDVDEALAGNVWLNLEHRLQLVTVYRRT
jgi:ribosomal protein S27AE